MRNLKWKKWMVPGVVVFVTILRCGPVQAATYVVQPDGGGDYPTIQAAITAASNNDIIELTDGTFSGSGNYNIDFLGKAITVRSQSGNAEDCIIDCQELGRGFLFITDEDATSVLEGVTITHGIATGGVNGYGGGVLCGASTILPPSSHYGSPTINNCIFSNNSVSGSMLYPGLGGGMYCCEDSSPSVNNCLFNENTAGKTGLNGSSGRGGGVAVSEGSPTFSNCIFSDNETVMSGTVSGFGGGFFCETCQPTFTSCRFSRNTAVGWGGGAACLNSRPTFNYCTFNDNISPEELGLARGGGLYCGQEMPALTTTVDHCTFYGNVSGIFLHTCGTTTINNTIIAYSTIGSAVSCISSSPTLSCCDVYGNAGGDYTDCIAGQGGVRNNFSQDPRFCDPVFEDFTLNNMSPCHPLILPCGQVGAWGEGCSGAMTFDVCPDGSGYGHIKTIQLAIDAALDGDTIELCDATYTGDGNRDIDFLGKAITVRSESGNPEACIIDCQAGDTNEHRGFKFISGEDSDSVLEGVKITNGFVNDDTSLGDGYDHGGGILCMKYDPGTPPEVPSSPTLNNCIITNNQAEDSGGGMYCEQDCSPQISNCTFSYNTSGYEGGGLYYRGAETVFENCSFTNNYSDGHGGGICCGGSNILFTGCNFSNNDAMDDGGGMAYFGQNTTISHCIFAHNDTAAHGGGLTDMGSNLILSYCTINHNTAVYYGAGASGFANGQIINCTFYGNGDVEAIYGSLSVLDNTIIAFNNGPAVVSTSPPVLNCCDIYGNAGGPGDVAGQIGYNGNIAMDPIFCNAAAEDFTLHCSSPCMPFSPPNQMCDLIGAWPAGCTSYTGDINLSCGVDLVDFSFLAAAWLTSSGDTGWNARCDIYSDGAIDLLDLAELAKYWLSGK
ncbi:MAG: right-handed parallel beta-helix repeat-containing protein [Sedimentisphaerales bacterium]|nr:right-handed parallel beta-helix repeat-containing protein [Sedimentisphaerales bacterium]